ncbi:MAG: Uma2 family endonuclease [Isosphaerales bacterium]
MNKTITKIGPADHGRPMSLEEFDEAQGQAGFLYELSRGIITVTDVPRKRHLLLVRGIRRQLAAYEMLHLDLIQLIAGGNECKLLVDDLDSERHPDVSVYLTPPPEHEDRNFWRRWVPEIVIEVVSPSSRKRDYKEKPEEYLRFGVKEYWIVDADKRSMIVMRRARGRWIETTIQPPAIYRPKLLTGLEFSIEAVFKSAGLA